MVVFLLHFTPFVYTSGVNWGEKLILGSLISSKYVQV